MVRAVTVVREERACSNSGKGGKSSNCGKGGKSSNSGKGGI